MANIKRNVELNSSVKRFLEDYDYLTYITPEDTVYNMMKGLWNEIKDKINPSWKFIDVHCKSAVFLRKIYSLLYWNDCWYTKDKLSQMNESDRKELEGLKLSDGDTRRIWILDHMLYGICPTDTLWAICSFELYEDRVGKHNNLRYLYEHEIELKDANADITFKKIREQFKDMRFNVVVGNPPYNNGMDLDFVNQSFITSTDYVCMITPAKWQTADANQRVSSKMGYGQFRREIVPHMGYVCFYPCCKDVFDIYQTDGITYYILDKHNKYDEATIENRCKDIIHFNSEERRSIVHRESLLNIGNEIIQFIGKYNAWKFTEVTGSKRYVVKINTKVSGYDWYNTKEPRYLLSISRILDRHKGETYEGESKEIFESDSLDECKSYTSWIYSRFVRFFLMANISKLNGILTDDCWRLVPAPPGEFDHIYTDNELYHYYGLDRPEAKTSDGIRYIDIISAVIKERK